MQRLAAGRGRSSGHTRIFGSSGIFNAARGYHPLNLVYGVPAFDAAAPDVFAASGHLYRLDPRSVLPAGETDGDHVDSNCDGFDD